MDRNEFPNRGQDVDGSGRVRNISDLARLAGVSPGTVSRALSDTGLISQKTRDRIKALAREHEFRPNIMARNLRIQKTGAIGVLIPVGLEKGRQISDPFFITMLGLLADELTRRGYDLLLSRVIPSDDDWLERFADSGRVDGLIVIGQSDQTDTIERVAVRYRPLVVWGGHSEGQKHCSVGSDNFAGGDLAATHLIERGCKRIAFFGDAKTLEVAHRLDGCRAAMARAGLADQLRIVPAQLDAEASRSDIARFLSHPHERPDGIFAASDVIAMTALQALAELGVRVPQNVKVVGYDGLPIGEYTVPRLTTIKQDIATGARSLVDLLIRRIGGEETSSVVMPPELLVRMSS